MQSKELLFFFFKTHKPQKSRKFFKNFYKILFFFCQPNGFILDIINHLFFCNLYAIRYIRLPSKKKYKHPLLAVSLIQKKQYMLTFKKSLSLLKHLFSTLLRLGRFFFEGKSKNRFILSFIFYLLSKKNLLHVYKTSLYLTK